MDKSFTTDNKRRDMTPNVSSPNLKQAATSSLSGFGSEHPAGGQKKKINFGESAENSQVIANGKKMNAKDAPTIGNPLMMKMEFQSRRDKKRGGLRSQSGAETLSKFSRGKLTSKSGRSGKSGSSWRSRSRKSGSRYEEEIDYEDMPVEEIDVLMEKAQREIDDIIQRKMAYLSNPHQSKKQKKKRIMQLEMEMQELREEMSKLEKIKDSKTPFYEKLPKDSAFYKHYMCIL